jgi:hypothetical protein
MISKVAPLQRSSINSSNKNNIKESTCTISSMNVSSERPAMKWIILKDQGECLPISKKSLLRKFRKS